MLYIAIVLNMSKRNDDLMENDYKNCRSFSAIVYAHINTSSNLVSESLRGFIILALSAQRLYFKIDRCLSVTQNDRRRSPTTCPYIGRNIVLRHEHRFISPSRTILCKRDRCIQTSCARHNSEYADNTRLDRAKHEWQQLSPPDSYITSAAG